MEVDLALVHIAHCCSKHGCKYGNEECPVVAGHAGADHPCGYCDMDDAEINQTVNFIVAWLEKRIAELDAESLDHRVAGYIRAAARDRAHNYRDVVRGLREGAWKA